MGVKLCHRLKVFENRVLGRIFEPMWNKVTGMWRKLHNTKLNDLYSSPNFIHVIKLRMRWWKRRGAYKVLVEKPEGKKPLGRPRHRCEENNEMDLQEMGLGHGLD